MYNHQDESRFKLGVYNLVGDGRGWLWFSFWENREAMQEITYFAYYSTSIYMRKLIGWTTTSSKYNIEWYLSLFPQQPKFKEKCLIRKGAAVVANWPLEQRSTELTGRPAQRFLLKTRGSLLQSFQENLMQKQSCRTEHTLPMKKSKKWHRQWSTSKGGKRSTTRESLLLVPTKCRTYTAPSQTALAKFKVYSQ